MSLLNEALRKKDREVGQVKKINLFKNRPKPRKGGKKRLSLLIIVIVLSIGLPGLAVWYGFLDVDPPSKTLHRVNSHVITENTVNNKPAIHPKPLQIPLEEKPKTQSIIASPMERKDQKIDKTIFEKNETSKDHHIKTTKPTKKETLKAKEERNMEQSQDVQKAGETPAPSSRQTEGLFFKKAVSYHRQNKLEMAIQMYLEVLAGNPEHPDALLNLSSAYIQSSAFSKARPLLMKLRSFDPENPQVLLNLAIVEIGLGRPNEAIDYLKRLESLTEEPQFEIYFHRGVALSHLHELGEALTWYKKAEKLSHDNPLLLFNMAVAYDKLERYDDALRYYVALLNNAGAPLSVDEKKKVEDRMDVLKMFLARQES
jgi:Flp pilus assembly protein TadD